MNNLGTTWLPTRSRVKTSGGMGDRVVAGIDPVTPGVFGGVQRAIRRIQPGGGIGEDELEIGQADAQAHAQLGDLRVTEIAEGFAYALPDPCGFLQGHLRKNHTELVASVTAGQIVFTQVAPYLLAQWPQYGVADDMAVRIIDLLEVIDINQCDGGVALLLLALVELEVQQIFPRTVVKQAGEAVGAAQGAEGAFVFR